MIYILTNFLINQQLKVIKARDGDESNVGDCEEVENKSKKISIPVLGQKTLLTYVNAIHKSSPAKKKHDENSVLISKDVKMKNRRNERYDDKNSPGHVKNLSGNQAKQ